MVPSLPSKFCDSGLIMDTGSTGKLLRIPRIETKELHHIPKKSLKSHLFKL